LSPAASPTAAATSSNRGETERETTVFGGDKGEKAKAYRGKRRTETGHHCTEKKKDHSSPPGHRRCASYPPWPSATTIQHRHSTTISAANASRTREGEEKQNRTERKKTRRGVEAGEKKNHISSLESTVPSANHHRSFLRPHLEPPSTKKEEETLLTERTKNRGRKQHSEAEGRRRKTAASATVCHHRCPSRRPEHRHRRSAFLPPSSFSSSSSSSSPLFTA